LPTDPINQHESFQCVLTSLTHFLGNLLESHSSQNCSKSSALNCGVLMKWATKKKMHLAGIGSTKQFLKASIQQCSLIHARSHNPSHSDVNSLRLEVVRSCSLLYLVQQRPLYVLVSLRCYMHHFLCSTGNVN